MIRIIPFSYVLFVLACATKAAPASVSAPSPGLAKDPARLSLAQTCLKVQEAIRYYNLPLANLDATEGCAKYGSIGKSVLERNSLDSLDCYRPIQKPICNLTFTPASDQPDGACEETRAFFVSLLVRCSGAQRADASQHCASFTPDRRIIMDREVFCRSSYLRERESQPEARASVYGSYLTEGLERTHRFKDHQQSACLALVDSYNHCSIVERAVLDKLQSKDAKGRTADASASDVCLGARSTKYCSAHIETMTDPEYARDCSDIVLPFLLGSKREGGNRSGACPSIKEQYLSDLKETKKMYLKQQRQLKDEIHKVEILMKTTQMVHNMINFLKTEMDRDDRVMGPLMDVLEKIQNGRVSLNADTYRYLKKLNSKITEFYGIVSRFEYPLLSKNSKEENISSVNRTKVFVNELINLKNEIIQISSDLRPMLRRAVNESADRSRNAQSNDAILQNIKSSYIDSRSAIDAMAEKNEDSQIGYYKSQEKDMKETIEEHGRLIELFSQQIGMVLQKSMV